ncbi:signal peptidase I [Enterocloster citroniae]|uniref:Signal peptidase I n=2 Tax=Enterocloster citroniae TaxID=358743 RepID=A0A0J9BYP3_9FIRM|nr:signal peptidase I [Enterocloster citroniae]KMW17908.1 signal peptidase I [[Clostridium] citroniae WAL-19142]
MGCMGKCLRTAVLASLVIAVLLNLCFFIRPELFGWSRAVILSGSMEPSMSIGDLVIVQREKEYRVGDIVVFDSGGLSVTHRILEKAQEGFVTKGDANNVPDKELLSENHIIGRVAVVIPMVGKAVLFLKNPAGMMLIMMLAIWLIWGADVVRMVKGPGGDLSE